MSKPIPEAEWEAMTATEKLESLIERSIDDANIILSFDLNKPGVSNATLKTMTDAKLSIIRCVLMNTARLNRDKRRLEDAKNQVFGEMAQEFKNLTVIDGDKK